MKSTKFLPFLLFLLAPVFAQAQDFVGSWAMSGTTPEGQAYNNTITFKADGTMTLDFGGDGKIDVYSTYTVAGDVVSVTDTSKESGCYGKVGKYRVAVAGKTFTATLIEDPCDARRGDGSPMVMTRM